MRKELGVRGHSLVDPSMDPESAKELGRKKTAQYFRVGILFLFL